MNKYSPIIRKILARIKIAILILALIIGASTLYHEFENVQYFNKIGRLRV